MYFSLPSSNCSAIYICFIHSLTLVLFSSQVKLDSRFKEDLSMDSLDHVEMIMMVEDEFGKQQQQFNAFTPPPPC